MQVMARHGKAHDLVNLQRVSAGLARTVLLLQPTGACSARVALGLFSLQSIVRRATASTQFCQCGLISIGNLLSRPVTHLAKQPHRC